VGAALSEDPRFHLAAQRTLLAWVRTGLAVMAFGFVVARFGAVVGFAVRDAAAAPADPRWAGLGVVLVGLGVAALVTGALQYHLVLRELAPGRRPPAHAVLATSAVAWALVLVGLGLGVLLLH
jgi:putative membrane protein